VALEALLPRWLGDVAVVFGDVPDHLDGATGRGVMWEASAQELWLEVPGVARYLAAGGRTLTVEPLPGADPAAVVRFARSTPLAALCYQRGMEAWHAAVAVRADRAVVLAGESATGKSTLLAALMGRGWRMLGDDLAAVTLCANGGLMVLPTRAEIRLWPDAVEQLGEAPGVGAGADSARTDVAGAPGSCWLPAGDRSVESPVAVGSIWRLGLHNSPGIEVVNEEGLNCFEAVGGLAFHGRIAHSLLDRVVHMRIAAAVASQVPFHRARRARGAWTVPELTDAVERADDAGEPEPGARSPAAGPRG
jgi:hypothetical protein